MAAQFKLHLGMGQLVLRDIRGVMFPMHIYGAPPYEGRPHWVLHTLGASLLPLEGRKGEERRFEFVMSLPEDWIPSERWPAYMFQRASTAILARGLAPDAGGVVFNSAEAVHGSPHVFALLVAPSRTLGEHAVLRTPAGRLVEVYAMCVTPRPPPSGRWPAPVAGRRERARSAWHRVASRLQRRVPCRRSAQPLGRGNVRQKRTLFGYTPALFAPVLERGRSGRGTRRRLGIYPRAAISCGSGIRSPRTAALMAVLR